MKTIELEILATDIAKNIHEGSACPIACALRRVLKTPLHVMAHKVVFFDSPDCKVRRKIGEVELPTELRNFIKAYDRGEKPVSPFKFTWTLPRLSQADLGLEGE